MLERIYIHNYKCLVNFDLRIHNQIILLLGANGSGKTAVLDVMFALRELLAGEARITDRIAFPRSTLTRWQTLRDQVFEIQAAIGLERFTYRLEIEHHEGSPSAHVSKESLAANGALLFKCKIGRVQLFHDDGSEGPAYQTGRRESALARVAPGPSNSRLSAFMSFIRDTLICAIRPGRLRTESNREMRLLDRHAGNFVDWYRHVVQENPMSIHRHVEALQKVIDGFRNVRLQQSGLDSRALMLDFVTGPHGDGHYRLRLDELSEGHQALIVLYALLDLRRDGGLLFIDEPDNYVALPEIQPWLMELVDYCDDTPSQAFIGSHHPELLDYLGPDCGIVLRRERSMVTTAHPVASLIASAPNYGLDLSELVSRGWLDEP